MKKWFVVIANATGRAGWCDSTFFVTKWVASKKTAIKQATAALQGIPHFRNAAKVDWEVEELTLDKLAAIVSGYITLSNAERNMRNEHDEQMHSLQWWRLYGLGKSISIALRRC